MRYGLAIAAGVLLLALGAADAAAGDARPLNATYHMTATDPATGAREIMNEDIARIAMRAAVPKEQAASLSRQDLLKLYVLLALQGKTKPSGL